MRSWSPLRTTGAGGFSHQTGEGKKSQATESEKGFSAKKRARNTQTMINKKERTALGKISRGKKKRAQQGPVGLSRPSRGEDLKEAAHSHFIGAKGERQTAKNE